MTISNTEIYLRILNCVVQLFGASFGASADRDRELTFVTKRI